MGGRKPRKTPRRYTGGMPQRRRNYPPIEERFWSKVSPEPNSGCWLWEGVLDSSGYGMIRRDGRMQKAHRVAYEMHRGPIPEGLNLLHVVCDNPMCANPDHCKPDTQLANVEDRTRKDRGARGERRPNAVLNDDLVRLILSSPLPTTDFARQHDLKYGTVYNVRKGLSWPHIERPKRLEG